MSLSVLLLKRVNHRICIWLACWLLVVLPAVGQDRPNIILLLVDDLNDWTGFMQGHPDTLTPNLDALASQGMAFLNAHCAAPSCSPSRAALMTGRDPWSTGLYANHHPWMTAVSPDETLPAVMKAAGYLTVGAGKVYHHVMGNNPPSQWDFYFEQVFDDYWTREKYQANRGWLDREPRGYPDWFPLNRLRGDFAPSHPDSFDWGPVDRVDPDWRTGDEVMVDWAVSFLENPPTAPFFFAAGIYRPHLPWYVPEEYFEPFDAESVHLPPFKPDDLDDVPPPGRRLAARRGDDFALVGHAGQYREAVTAYLASVHFTDAQVGRLLAAIRKGGIEQNTVVILTSDHGWHLGEKWHWHKDTLWERATRVPLLVYAPGITTPGSSSRTPVSLVDIFPTITELTGAQGSPSVTGTSLLPQLHEPNLDRDQPAVITQNAGSFAVRSERWRYIRYADGSEELYDHTHDPHEWENLAGDDGYDDVIARHAAALPPQSRAAPVRHSFDPETYQWTPIDP